MRIGAVELLVVLGTFTAAPCFAHGVEDQQAEIRETAQDTLSRLYEAQPAPRTWSTALRAMRPSPTSA